MVTEQGGARYLRTESRAVQVVLVSVLILAMASSFAVGAVPLYKIARDTLQLPAPVAVGLPIMLDLGAVASALAAVVLRQRGLPVHASTLTLIFVMSVSVAAQILHAYDLYNRWSVPAVTAALILSASPAITVAVSHLALQSLVQDKKQARSRKRAPNAARQVAPTVTQSDPVPKPATVRSAPKKTVTDSSEVPERTAGETDVAYAVRLNTSHGLSQRASAEQAGISRGRLETALRKQRENENRQNPGQEQTVRSAA